MTEKQTTYYGLRRWGGRDLIDLEEVNGNFDGLDEALHEGLTGLEGALEELDGRKPDLSAGAYTGDGAASQFISLGFTPKAVLVVPANGNMTNLNGGLAVTGCPAAYSTYNMLAVEEGGFRAYYRSISASNVISLNSTGTHYYLALG